MATAETQTSQEAGDRPGGLLYDGFISYSHAADDLLAPRLRAGLQRFAKPWWKRRALRIFRDESSLSANPHLWSSITDALDNSDWFVLLLSPEAADSEWVNQEVEFWLEHKDSDRIIPVVTDGEFTWSETDIDLESTAVPPALYGAFSDEPRWVDLRFARSEEQLDLNNPRFSAAVADIASAIRGVPKDELESEEVHQHRRTVRTAWAAAAGLLILALLAGGAALFALDRQAEANEQRQFAEDNAAEADRQRQQAEENAAEAGIQREAAEISAAAESEARLEAERSALLASSNELALRAEKEIPVDAERAMLLAIEAIGLAREADIEPVEATRSLRSALSSSRIVQRLPGGSISTAFVAVASDGTMLATESDQGVGVWDTTSWELIATFAEPDAIAAKAGFSQSGDRLAVAFLQVDSDSQVSPVVVYDLAGGPDVRLEGDPLPTLAQPEVEFASGGESIVATRFDADTGGYGTGVWSAITGLLEYQLEEGDLVVDPSGERVAIIRGFADGRLRIHDIATGAVLVDVGGSEDNTNLSFSPDGTRLAETSQNARRLMIRDAGSGEVLLDAQVDRIAGVAWLDESRVAVGGEGSTRIVDTDTGDILFELAGHTDVTWHLAAIPGTDLLATASFDGTVLIWDVSPHGLTELPSWNTGLADVQWHWAGPDGSVVLRHDTDTGLSLWALADDGSTAVPIIDGLASGAPGAMTSQDGTRFAVVRTDGTSGVVSIPDGEMVYTAPPGLEAKGVNNDGSLVVLAEPYDEARATEQIPVVVETDTGKEMARLTPPLDINYQFSPDSSMVSHVWAAALNTSVYLLPGGEPTGSFDFGYGTLYSDSGAILVFPVTETLSVWLLDTERLKATKDIESARAAEILLNESFIFPSLSPDETKLVTTTFDEPLKVWDITGVLEGREPTLIAEIDPEPRSGPPSVTFRPDGKRILSRSENGVLLQFTLDTDELISIAQSRLTRTLTPDECTTFGIDPCPTLEDGS